MGPPCGSDCVPWRMVPGRPGVAGQVFVQLSITVVPVNTVVSSSAKTPGLEWGEAGRAERPAEGRGQVSRSAQGDPNTPCLLLVFRNKYIQEKA